MLNDSTYRIATLLDRSENVTSTKTRPLLLSYRSFRYLYQPPRACFLQRFNIQVQQMVKRASIQVADIELQPHSSSISSHINPLTLTLLTWRIWWSSNNASKWQIGFNSAFKGLNAELNPICHLLALLGAHHILHVSRIRVKLLFEIQVSHTITITVFWDMTSHRQVLTLLPNLLPSSSRHVPRRWRQQVSLNLRS